MLLASTFILFLAFDVCQSVHNFVNSSDGEGMVVAVRLPKSGSSSLTSFLNQLDGEYVAAHWISKGCNHSELEAAYPIPALRLRSGITWKAIKNGDTTWKGHKNGTAACFNAVEIQRAMVDGRPPLSYVMDHGVNAVVQMDALFGGINIWPQIDALDEILDAYPRARYVHHVRNATEQVSSINRWSDMSSRIDRSGLTSRFPGQSKNNSRDENIALMITNAQKLVRDAFSKRPTYLYLEIDIAGDPYAGAHLSRFLGFSRIVTMPHSNKNTKKSDS
jgi:hypothetical protein